MSLNPILSVNTSEVFVDDLLFLKMITMNAAHAQVPELAAVVPTLANGGISRDGLTITYHLRHNVRWTDGVPVTSEDVKYSYEQIMNPSNDVISRHGFDRIRSLDTPDKSTVVLHMKDVFPPIIDAFFGESDNPYGILPAHVLSRYPNLNHVPFNGEPTVTDGPYRFGRWVRGDHIEVIANDRYFRGVPAIKVIDLKEIPDANTMTSELRTGEVQMDIEMTGPSYHEIQSDPRVAHLAVDAPSYDSLILNCGRAPLSDRTVRIALSFATDRDALNRENEFGEATVAAGDLSPFSWAYDPNVHAQPYDPAKARALLEADGWKAGPGGIRRKNNRRLSLLLVYGQGSDVARNMVAEVQQMWRAVGIEVQPKTIPYAMMYAPEQEGGILASGKYDVGFNAWIAGRDPDDSTQFLSTALPPQGENFSRYQLAEMDRLQAQALSTFDVSQRKDAYAQIQQLMVDDVPTIFLFYRKMLYGYSPALRNFDPNGVGEAWNAYAWTFSSSSNQ